MPVNKFILPAPAEVKMNALWVDLTIGQRRQAFDNENDLIEQFIGQYHLFTYFRYTNTAMLSEQFTNTLLSKRKAIHAETEGSVFVTDQELLSWVQNKVKKSFGPEKTLLFAKMP